MFDHLVRNGPSPPCRSPHKPTAGRVSFGLAASAAVGAFLGLYPNVLAEADWQELLGYCSAWAIVGAAICATEEWIQRQSRGPFWAAVVGAAVYPAGVVGLQWFFTEIGGWQTGWPSAILGGTLAVGNYLAVWAVVWAKRMTMDRKQRHARVLDALQRLGVSVLKYEVLGIVHYRIPLPPHGIARYAKQYAEEDGNLLGEHPLDDYLQAVQTCIDRGWLTVLTPEQIEEDKRRCLASSVPEVLDPCYGAGAVDFTAEGYSFYRSMAGKIHGRSLDTDYSGWNWNKDRQVIDIYASGQPLCRRVLIDLQENLADTVGEPATLAGVEDPAPIGPWKPFRFLTLPEGFHAVIRVKLLAPTQSTE